MKRRVAITAGTAWLMAGSAIAQAPDAAERALRLQAGEAALERGDAAAAMAAFERAAETEHALDIELGIVHSAMQAGRYRSALQFAAHTAGAHADAPEGAVLYAWLLAIGGQLQMAHRTLAQAEARLPGNGLIARARHALAVAAPPPADPPLTDLRVAPHSSGNLPPGSRVVATGFSIPGSGFAVAPSAALPQGARIWSRNGLGMLLAMRIEGVIDALGLTVLRRAGAGPAVSEWPQVTLAEHDPFPGSPAMSIQHVAPGHSAAAAWPWLHHGFLGATTASGTRRLGIDLPPGPHGGPVFDSAGRWIGIAIRATHDEPSRLLLPSMLREHLAGVVDGAAAAASATSADAGRMPADAVYERALALVLQIVCEA